MLCFDNNLLADYLDGVDAAKDFLEQYDSEPWAVPSLVCYEAYMGALYGRPRGSIEDVHEATRGFEVYPVTDDTALIAARLQRSLQAEGVQLDQVDAVLAATAKEHGARFATNEKTFRKEAVQDHLDVVVYPR